MKTNENEQALQNSGIGSGRMNLNGLDLFKFIMAIFVVAIHTEPLYGIENKTVVSFFSVLTSCAVSFFFIASGYLLARKFEEPYCCKSNRNAVIRYLKKILKMYFIWTAVYFPLAVYYYHKENYSVLYSILVTVRKFVFRGDNYNSWMLWYLLATIYALIFIWITMKAKCGWKCLPVIAVVMVFISSGIYKISWTEQTLPTVLEFIRKLIFYTITDARVLTGTICLPLGIYLYKKEKIIKYAKYLFVPAVIGLLFTNNEIISQILSIAKVLGLFSIAISVRLKDSPIYKTLRSSSTVVYFIHMYISTFI